MGRLDGQMRGNWVSNAQTHLQGVKTIAIVIWEAFKGKCSQMLGKSQSQMQLTFHCICICPENAFVVLACNWIGVRTIVLDTDVALRSVCSFQLQLSFQLQMHLSAAIAL